MSLITIDETSVEQTKYVEQAENETFLAIHFSPLGLLPSPNCRQTDHAYDVHSRSPKIHSDSNFPFLFTVLSLTLKSVKCHVSFSKCSVNFT